jgi:glycosyltransferase involved in cell wall biosynthesis
MGSNALVSIGLPTYNRAEKLEHAMEFILAQDYRNIEIVISDNASTDRTAEVCRQLQARDSRIRYIRQRENIGPTANYRAVLAASTGDMYMAIADDDWLAPNYVSECLRGLVTKPDHVLVCGKSQMYRDGMFAYDAPATLLHDETASDRVVRYYATVIENGAFHGVIRREVLMSLPGMPQVLAGDWLWMASIAFQGKITTLDSTGIVKHLGGATVGWDRIISVLGLPNWQAQYWSEAILANVIPNIAWRSPVYAPLGMDGRALLAARVAKALAFKWRIWSRWRGYLSQLVR